MKVCIGGTFNILHKGHEVIISRAIATAGENGMVFIGLTKGDLAENKTNTKPYRERKKNLEKYLKEKDFFEKVVIKPIKDKYGPTLSQGFDAIVVSPETVKTAEEINIIRKEKGKKPLRVVEVAYELAQDGKPISSTRISRGEIDRNGKILKED